MGALDATFEVGVALEHGMRLFQATCHSGDGRFHLENHRISIENLHVSAIAERSGCAFGRCAASEGHGYGDCRDG
jgi:hypothetical protein